MRRVARPIPQVALAIGIVLVALFPLQAQAQEPPILPPLPPIPSELTPVLEIIGPAVHVACASAVTVVIRLVPTATGDSASEIVQLAGPVLTLCGSVPTATGRRCALDEEGAELVNALASTIEPALVGVVVALFPVPALLGMGVDTIIAVEDQVPDGPIPPAALSNQLIPVLSCALEEPASEPPAPTSTVDVPSEVVEVEEFATSPPPFGEPLTLDDLVVDVPELQRVVTAPAAEVLPLPIESGYAYPMIWLLPLVLLAAGAGAARALTGDYSSEEG